MTGAAAALLATLLLSPEGLPVRLEPAWHVAGEAKNGELGFRFGAPRDADGDGVAEVAGGARFTDLEAAHMGTVSVWSSKDGRELAFWEGHSEGGLFGHATLLGPDADGDKLPDVVASAPASRLADAQRGMVFARSPLSRRTLWVARGEPREGLGWDLAVAGDHNDDGALDVLAGAPSDPEAGKAYLLSGKDGAVLRVYRSERKLDAFGWCVASVADLDGDGLDDVLVGAPYTSSAGLDGAGAAYALSAASGRVLHRWGGAEANGKLGEMLAGIPDIDGDGVADVAASAPYATAGVGPMTGEVLVYSGGSGSELRRWTGTQAGELYGRMLAAAGDIDRDGAGDVAVAAPWFRAGLAERAGRFEVRSGRDGSVLARVEGDRPQRWLGWHITTAEDMGPGRRSGLLVSAVRSQERGQPGAGAMIFYALPAR